MQTEALGQFGLRQSHTPARSSDVHEDRYMRISIFSQGKICAQEFDGSGAGAYALRMDHFADNVRLMAKRYGSQENLAAEIGTTQGTVSKWLKSGSIRDMKLLHALASRANVTPDDFLNKPIGEIRTPELPMPPAATIMLPVALPNVDALEAMFATMLVGSERRSPAELARRLAEGLPRGLSQAIGTQSQMTSDAVQRLASASQSPSTHLPEAR